MSIKSSIERSLDDNLKPSQKSYSRCKLDFKLIDVNLYRNKKDRSEAEERLVGGELTIETIKELILIRNVMSKEINLWQIRDILNDIGFNTDADLVETYSADLNAVYNFGGYIIPYYKQFVEMICKKGSKFRKLLLYKLAPGKSRLHIRLFDIRMGQWLISAHIDHVNWMNF